MKFIKLWIAAICILALALCQFSAIAEDQISVDPAPVDLQSAAEPNEAPAAPEYSDPEHSEPESPESDGDSFLESQDVVPYEAADETITAVAAESEEYDP